LQARTGGLPNETNRLAFPHVLNVVAAQRRKRERAPGKAVQVFGQYLFSGAGRSRLSGKSKLPGPLMGIVLSVRERNPIKSIGKNRVHWLRFGWPGK
jgi:hypothetical protein